MSSWLDQHPSEVVVLFFGNIARPEETVPRLITTLRSVFPRGGPGVGMNSVYKTEGRWPTLGEAKEGDNTFSRFFRGDFTFLLQPTTGCLCSSGTSQAAS